MIVQYCDNCGRRTGHKRVVGVGTIFASLITCGIWIFLTPFYPKRCVVCGLTKAEGEEGKEKEPRSVFAQPGTYVWIFVAVMAVVMIFGK